MQLSLEFLEREQKFQIFNFELSFKFCRSGTGEPLEDTAFLSRYHIICNSQCYLHKVLHL